jgi:TatD DNase family protein
VAGKATSRPGHVLTDTHVHLNLKDFSRDRDEVIARALEAGVGLMINVGFDLATTRGSIELAEQHDFIYATAGIHPHEASSYNHETEKELRELAAHPRVVAIGEIGLDYYRNLSPRGDQLRAFRAQIRLARELGLPLVIHNRDALDDVLDVVDEEGAGGVGGVMHCFPGDADYAREVVDRGFHVGIGGPITYSREGRFVRAVRAIPLNRILLETDSPWLTPEPFKGQGTKRNEPAFVSEVAEAVAIATGIGIEDIVRQTTGNAMRLFRIPEKPVSSIAYEMWGNLYLNITNRCTNECRFCIRYQTDILWGYNLRLEREPSTEELLEVIGDPTRYREVVFCGYGEPTIRLDVIKAVAARVRELGGKVRIDTNGHGNLIWNRNIVPELALVADSISVSLNAESAAVYESICRPKFGAGTYEHVRSFIRECVKTGLDVTVSVVDIPEIDIKSAKRVADELDVPFRVRGGGRRRPEDGGD